MVGRLLGIRLPEKIMDKFDLIAQQRNETSNQLGKKALIEWIEVLFTSRNLNMIIFPKEILIKTLSYLNKEQQSEIAKDVATNIIEYFQFLFKTHIKHFSDEIFNQVISKFLGASGAMWFDHLEFDLNKQQGKFQASHTSGIQWSQFSSIVMQKIFKDHFKYEILEDSIISGKNSVYFNFSK
ncbi:hypothetical protein NEF87_003470 [Candidatus Lokiarchaeum ossiferum]|uniref:4-vinyl reductase 4VR domain-containing protein n=1 Tax=Candidatus Lokiarchaeum ossiferum TaxID=2951803 RepID=A0ABY6HUI9_9ARCH|nr:hypothetical protein NEF87_003470 [Candidatus Lokiarchaeum sp. B-35]